MPRKKREEVIQTVRKAMAELAEQTMVEAESTEPLKPGAHLPRGIGKVPWTMKDLEKAYGVVEWTPQMTCPITVSGIQLYAFSGVSWLTPTCFKDVHDESLKRMRNVGKSLVGRGVERGALGPLPLET